MLKHWTGIISIITLLLIGSTAASAEGQDTDQEVFAFLQEAFQSQLSLGERHHTMKEIDDILNPYFSTEYQKNFLEEHLFNEKEGYITYGTDFPAYYIPFFSYTDETKIVREEGTITVYEFFQSEENMPSLYDDHYEYVKLKKNTSGWEVVEYGFEYEEPDFVKDILSLNENQNETDLEGAKYEPLLTNLYSFGYIFSPFYHHSYAIKAPMIASQMIQEKQHQSFLVAR